MKTYEEIEERIEELNEEITELNNRLVKATWINKEFETPEAKRLEKKINALMDEKYELIDLIK